MAPAAPSLLTLPPHHIGRRCTKSTTTGDDHHSGSSQMCEGDAGRRTEITYHDSCSSNHQNCTTSQRNEGDSASNSGNMCARTGRVVLCDTSNRDHTSSTQKRNAEGGSSGRHSVDKSSPERGVDEGGRSSVGDMSGMQSNTSSSDCRSCDEQGALYSSKPVFLCFRLSPLRPDLVVALAFCEDIQNMPLLCHLQLQKQSSTQHQRSGAETVTKVGRRAAPALRVAVTETQSAIAGTESSVEGAVVRAKLLSEQVTTPQQVEGSGAPGVPTPQETTFEREEGELGRHENVCCVGMNPSMIVSIDQVMQGVLTAIQHWEDNSMNAADLQKEILYCCSPGGRSISRSLQQLGMQPQQQRLLLIVVLLPNVKRCDFPVAARFSLSVAEKQRQPGLSEQLVRDRQQQHGTQAGTQQDRPEQQNCHWKREHRQLPAEESQGTRLDSVRWWEKAEGRWRVDIEQALRESRDAKLLRGTAQISHAEEMLPGGLEAAVLARVAAKFV